MTEWKINFTVPLVIFFQFGISILQGRWVGQNIMEPGITMYNH